MVVHLVCFKYKGGVDGPAREDHRTRLRGLAGLDGILDFKVGEDFMHLDRSFDTGVVVLFRDRAALDGYAKHPQHIPIAQLGRDLSSQIVAVDFEA